MGLQVPDEEADLAATGRNGDNMKTWYLATYKKSDGNYSTALVLSDSEAKAEEHFKDYDMSTVRIAAEDEIYYYRSMGCTVVEL